MIDGLPHLKLLVRHLQQVPYLASKNLYRVTEHFLKMDVERLDQFVAVLTKAKQNLVACTVCWVWKEREKDCSLCSDPQRDSSKICVVETWHDLMALDKTGGYTGLYHVLGGAISPLDGLSPDDLKIDDIVERVSNSPECKEIILALNQTPEGEATAAFIARKLENMPLRITCLARGIPVGSQLEFMDRITVYKALTERRPF